MLKLDWSPQQERALSAVANWLHMGDEQQVFRLFGYAGTGKTTLAKHFAEGVDGVVRFGAFTGKAASVLRAKGCENASTIHSMIYQPKGKSRLTLVKLERDLVAAADRLKADPDNLDLIKEVAHLERTLSDERDNVSQPAFTLLPYGLSDVANADLVIIDECSMVDPRMGEDLLSYGTKILVLGDPAQLPPVRGTGFFTDHEPDILLTEIHRQARDNPIIHLATLAREEQTIKPGTYGDSVVMERGARLNDEPLTVSQILTGRNATRRSCNDRVRELLRLGKGPIPGDKLVCLRNNHELGLLNGSQWKVVDAGGVDSFLLYMSVEPIDGGFPVEVEAWAAPFEGEDLGRMPYWERKDAEEFDYGYALTVHKAQGSQWDSVLVIDESSAFRADRWRHLYTAITRAAERVIIFPN
jgi:exodeoxyribonuclease-5